METLAPLLNILVTLLKLYGLFLVVSLLLMVAILVSVFHKRKPIQLNLPDPRLNKSGSAEQSFSPSEKLR